MKRILNDRVSALLWVLDWYKVSAVFLSFLSGLLAIVFAIATPFVKVPSANAVWITLGVILLITLAIAYILSTAGEKIIKGHIKQLHETAENDGRGATLAYLRDDDTEIMQWLKTYYPRYASRRLVKQLVSQKRQQVGKTKNENS